MTTYMGPSFQLVDEITTEEFVQRPRAEFHKPALLKGALKAWPAYQGWSFEHLAELRHSDGKEVVCRFQDGLVEQGATNPLPMLPVAPYMRELEQASRTPVPASAGLLSEARRKQLNPGERFTLDWSYMQSFDTNRRYLADWPVLSEFPELRRDFEIQTLWPGLRWTWEYMFVGPAHTVTGLHQDIHNNWFCQVRGSKELLLFAPDQTPSMHVSGKFNLGSVLSEIDISKLDRHPEMAADFAKTRGLYVRAEAGDALYIPKSTWHTVISLEPSISLGIFGLNAFEVVTAGAWSEFKNLVHLMRLYKWRNCICHASRKTLLD